MEKLETGEEEELASLLARHVASLEYDNLPKEVVEITKNSILDTLGVISAATGLGSGCRELAELIMEAGGQREGTIIGFGGRVPSWMAAFVNGSMANALDYDDLHGKVAVHPSACIIPAAFATAESVGIVDGRKFITAVALGIDMVCRMGFAIEWEFDWILSSVFGAFGSAATSGKLLEFGEDKLVDAFGVALCQAGCTMELCYSVGSNLRGAYPGFAAKAGVLSAMMARKGINGPRNSMEGKGGLYPVYFKGQKYDRNAIITDLGRRFEGINVGFKPWPACALTHSYITATLKAIEEHSIRPEDIKQITAFVNEVSQQVCEPLQARRQPLSITDAKFSLPFTLAIAATSRRVMLADYTLEKLKCQHVLALAQKVVPKLDEQVKRIGAVTQGVVEISTKQGKTYQSQADFAHGRPEDPMSRGEIIAKFKDCIGYSVKAMSKEDTQKVVDMVVGLEDVRDVSQIMRLLG